VGFWVDLGIVAKRRILPLLVIELRSFSVEVYRHDPQPVQGPVLCGRNTVGFTKLLNVEFFLYMYFCDEFGGFTDLCISGIKVITVILKCITRLYI
jgi:hypothetical protein